MGDDLDDELDDDLDRAEFEAAAVQYMLHGAWGRWAIRLMIGVTIVVVVVLKWPSLWWVALVYAPAPILSGAWNLHLMRKYGRSAHEVSGSDS